MINGLLIEDDPNKADKIISFINEYYPSIQIVLKMSYQSGIQSIFQNEYKFILLDMSLPSYDQGQGSFSGKPKGYGGRDILKEMKRYGKHSLVKVITQYNEFDGGLISMKELDEQLVNKYPNLYQGYIIYNSKQSEWQNFLKDFLNAIVK